MPCLLLGTLWLFARLIAPAVAMPAPVSVADAVALQALQTLCHSAPQNDPGGPAPAHAPPRNDCLLCPACHILGLAAVVNPGGPALRPPAQRLIGLAAPCGRAADRAAVAFRLNAQAACPWQRRSPALTAIRTGELHAIEHGLCRALFDYTAAQYLAKQLYLLVLAGIACLFLFQALQALLQFLASPEALQQIVFWLFGSLLRSSMTKVGFIALVLAAAGPVLLADCWRLTALKLGDERARASACGWTRCGCVPSSRSRC